MLEIISGECKNLITDAEPSNDLQCDQMRSSGGPLDYPVYKAWNCSTAVLWKTHWCMHHSMSIA